MEITRESISLRKLKNESVHILTPRAKAFIEKRKGDILPLAIANRSLRADKSEKILLFFPRILHIDRERIKIRQSLAVASKMGCGELILTIWPIFYHFYLC